MLQHQWNTGYLASQVGMRKYQRSSLDKQGANTAPSLVLTTVFPLTEHPENGHSSNYEQIVQGNMDLHHFPLPPTPSQASTLGGQWRCSRKKMPSLLEPNGIIMSDQTLDESERSQHRRYWQLHSMNLMYTRWISK